MFGAVAEYYIDNSFGREIDRHTAMMIIDQAEEDGLVHFSTNHTGDKGFLCNCCSCCCKGLGFLTQHQIASFIAPSKYQAEIDPERCTTCGTCINRCPVKAINAPEFNIEAERCIGCGLCYSSCPEDCIRMALRPVGLAPAPYQNEFELYLAGARARNIDFPFV